MAKGIKATAAAPNEFNFAAAAVGAGAGVSVGDDPGVDWPGVVGSEGSFPGCPDGSGLPGMGAGLSVGWGTGTGSGGVGWVGWLEGWGSSAGTESVGSGSSLERVGIVL